MGLRSIQPVPLVTAYAQLVIPEHTHRHRTPIIREVFRPGGGWRRISGQQRLSLNKVRSLKRENVTAIGVEIARGRVADFRVDELLGRQRGAMKYPNRAGTR
jgi:hypothetical protein